MSECFMPVEFMDILQPLLPPDTPVGPKGGRPPVRNGVVLPVIWYVLSTGVRWHDILPVMGCSGRTAPEVATVAGKRRLESVTYETAGPSQP